LFIVFSASLAFILPILTNNLIKFKKIIIIFLLTTFFTCCFGIFQFIGDSFDLSTHITQLRPHYTKKILGFTRIQSTFIEPLYFGNFLILPLCLTTAFILNDKKNKKKNKTNNSKNKYNNNSYNNNNKYNDKTNKIICKKEKKSPLNTYKTLLNNKKSYYKLLPYLFNKYFLFILLFLIIINLILTSSRGAYIGALSGLFVILVFYRKKIFKLNKILMISCLIFISFIALNIFLNIYSSNFAQNTQTVFKKHIFNLFSGAAYVERIDTFKASLNLFSIHPYIGIGIGNFGPSISKDHLTKPKNGWPIVNNQILEILTETGIFGLFFILIFTLYILFKVLSILHKSQKLEIRIMALSLLAAFLGIIFQYQTFSTLYIMHIWFIIGLIISLDFIIKKNNSLNKTNK
jgi:O-antigen ligase